MNVLSAGGLFRFGRDGQLYDPVLRPEWRHGNWSFVNTETGGYLRVRQADQTLDCRGRGGKWAQFTLEAPPGGGVTLSNVGHRELGRTLYLAGGRSGTLEVASADSEQTCLSVVSLTRTPEAPEPRVLTSEQAASFVRDGFLVLRGAVNATLTTAALSAVNGHLGLGRAAWADDEDGKPALSAEIKSHPAVMSLMHDSGLVGAVRSLLGSRISEPRAAQVALRFPCAPGKERGEASRDQWHIDGMRKEHQSPFNVLLGVALSAQPEDDCGNLVVWPGAHAGVHTAVKRARDVRCDNGRDDGSAEGDVESVWAGQRPALPPDRALQLHLQPGDAVLLHQKMPHRVALNRSPHIRYQAYFRVSHVDHRPAEPLSGLWRHFDGLKQHGEVDGSGEE